jgi:hypothetical protein
MVSFLPDISPLATLNLPFPATRPKTIETLYKKARTILTFLPDTSPLATLNLPIAAIHGHSPKNHRNPL